MGAILVLIHLQSSDVNHVVQIEDMPRIIFLPKYFSELDLLPESTLSHRESIVLRHLGQYTGMYVVTQSHLHSDICRTHLRRNLRERYKTPSNDLELMSP